MAVHLHCYQASCRIRPEIVPPVTGTMLSVFLIVVVFAQTYLLQSLLVWGRQEFQIRMTFASVFHANDVVMIQPGIAPREWRRGDIAVGFQTVQADNAQTFFFERVYGLPGDRMALRGDRLLVNGKPVSGKDMQPITFENNGIRVPESEDVKDVALESGRSAGSEILVPEGHLGFVFRNQILIKPMQQCRGVVEAITHPSERARFLRAR